MLVRRDADDIREIRPRAAIGVVVVVCSMLVLVARLYQLQVLRGQNYTLQSIANFRKTLFVPADRGLIKDRRGRTLVDNRPSFDVFMTPAFCKGKERDDVIARLQTYLHLENDDIERIKADYQKSWFSKDKLERFKPFLIALDIPRDQVDVLEEHRTEMSCVNLIPTPHRAYHAPVSLGHVLGYMSEVTPDELDDHPEYRRGQTIGRRGLERRWERDLRGEDGRQNIAVDAKGRELDKDTQEALIPESERLVAAKPGKNLLLSLDERLQKAADAAFPGRAGAVVVMEAKTGFVLAMVSRPSFDANKMSGRISKAELATINADPLKPMLFRVMNENYHPGSTFKVVTSLAALESGVLTPNATQFCGGGYTMGNHRWRCDKPQGHGSLDLKRALAVSCDVFYYTVGDKVGLDPLSAMARRLGYGQPTGFDLGREISGIIPDSKSVTPESGSVRAHAINASIGQGEVNVTPLQQAVAYAAIANGGNVLRPQIVRRIEMPDGRVEREFKPDVLRKLGLKDASLAAVRAGLVAVVNEPGGTAFRSRLRDVRFAGKTGTAQVMKLGQKQKLDPAAQAYYSRDHAWFASFAPADDPEIVVVVLNEHGGWGAEAAAPAAAKIIEAYFRLKREDEAIAAAAPAAQVAPHSQVQPVLSQAQPASIPVQTSALVARPSPPSRKTQVENAARPAPAPPQADAASVSPAIAAVPASDSPAAESADAAAAMAPGAQSGMAASSGSVHGEAATAPSEPSGAPPGESAANRASPGAIAKPPSPVEGPAPETAGMAAGIGADKARSKGENAPVTSAEKEPSNGADKAPVSTAEKIVPAAADKVPAAAAEKPPAAVAEKPSAAVAEKPSAAAAEKVPAASAQKAPSSAAENPPGGPGDKGSASSPEKRETQTPAGEKSGASPPPDAAAASSPPASRDPVAPPATTAVVR